MPGAYLWGWSGTAFKKVRVDAAGHLQVDIVDAGVQSVRCMGWDGGDYEYLQFESTTNLNLKSAIFGGATGPVLVTTPDATHVTTDKSLLASAILYGWDGTNYRRIHITTHGETMPTTHYAVCTNAVLYAWDGSNYTRLLVDASDFLKVNVAAVDATLTTVDSFGGNVYSKTMTMEDNNATRFETAAKKLRDVVIIVKTHPMLLGETGVEVYPVGANEAVGFTKVDISTLYFKNAGAGNNGVITIIGTEE